MELNIVPSDICTALAEKAIGSRVSNLNRFYVLAEEAVANHDFTQDRIQGQAYIVCDMLAPYVSCGVGLQSKNPDDYVLREHRGNVSAYLKREFAAKTTGVALVVYTRAAYLSDPDITPEEASRIIQLDASHIIVAVLASAGPPSPLTPYRLVHNLAGGNKEAQVWTADEIRAKAKEALEYHNRWSTVSD
jgi:hypothetical protein